MATPTTLVVALGLFLAGHVGEAAHAHGGAYRGPGDNLPPGASTVPAPSGAAPGTPGALPSPSGSSASPGVPSAATIRAPAATEPDSSVWQLWWGYNNAAYVDIKRAVHSSDLLGGSSGFFLGRRPPGGASDRIVPTRAVIEQRVVPALLAVLATERDADMVTGALIALAKIGEVEGRPTSTSARLAAFLSDDNQEIAETAAIALGILADRGSVATLTALLLDRPGARALLQKGEVPWRTRAFAAYGLGLIGNRVADEPLRESIVDTLAAALSSEAILELATPDVRSPASRPWAWCRSRPK